MIWIRRRLIEDFINSKKLFPQYFTDPGRIQTEINYDVVWTANIKLNVKYVNEYNRGMKANALTIFHPSAFIRRNINIGVLIAGFVMFC